LESGNLYQKPLKMALVVATPAPVHVPLTEITELQLLLTIIAQSSDAVTLKLIVANKVSGSGR
jgi:hypothetical protein